MTDDDYPSPSRQKDLKKRFAYRRLPVDVKKGKTEARLDLAESNVEAAARAGEITPGDKAFLMKWLNDALNRVQDYSQAKRAQLKAMKAHDQDVVAEMERDMGDLPDGVDLHLLVKFLDDMFNETGKRWRDLPDFLSDILGNLELDSQARGKDTYEKLWGLVQERYGITSAKIRGEELSEYDIGVESERAGEWFKESLSSQEGFAELLYHDLTEIAQDDDKTRWEVLIEGLADPELVDWLIRHGHKARVDALRSELGGAVEREAAKRRRTEADDLSVSERLAERKRVEEKRQEVSEKMDEQARLQASMVASQLTSTLKDIVRPLREEVQEVREGQKTLREILDELMERGVKRELPKQQRRGPVEKVAEVLSEIKAMEATRMIKMLRMPSEVQCLGCGEFFRPWSHSVQNKFISFPRFYQGASAQAYFGTCDECHKLGHKIYDAESKPVSWFPMDRRAGADIYLSEHPGTYIKPHTNSFYQMHQMYPTLADFIYAAYWDPEFYPDIVNQIPLDYLINAVRAVHYEKKEEMLDSFTITSGQFEEKGGGRDDQL